MYYYLFTPFPNKLWFLRVCRASLLKTPWEKEKLLVSFENTLGKGEIARNEQYLLFPQCILPWRTFRHSRQILNCRLQILSVWKNLKFEVWERVENKVASFKPSLICSLQIICIWTNLLFC